MATVYLLGRNTASGFQIQKSTTDAINIAALAGEMIDTMGIGAKFKTRLAAEAVGKAGALALKTGASIPLTHMWDGPQVIAFDDGVK